MAVMSTVLLVEGGKVRPIKKILVCGSRELGDAAWFDQAMDRLLAGEWAGIGPGPHIIASGDAPGADTLAREWAGRRGHVYVGYPAQWTMGGPAAGPARNDQMLKGFRPDLFVAFPGGDGTADMTARARKAGVRTIEILST